MKTIEIEKNYNMDIDVYNVQCKFFNGYLRLTDIAKFSDSNQTPDQIVANWFRTQPAIKFMTDWEGAHNPNFNYNAAIAIMNESLEKDSNPSSEMGLNNSNPSLMKDLSTDKKQHKTANMSLSPQRWIKETNAIGVLSRRGNGGGTYAHVTIATRFAIYVSEPYARKLIERYYNLCEFICHEYNAKVELMRDLAGSRYSCQTSAISDCILPNFQGNPREAFASEADMLNVVICDITAKMWRAMNPELAAKGMNIRDDPQYGNYNNLYLFTHLEQYNAGLIRAGLDQPTRFTALMAEADRILPIYDGKFAKYLAEKMESQKKMKTMCDIINRTPSMMINGIPML